MNNRKKIFFTSDLHVFHENVLDFDKRPFDDIEHMHRVLINNYNATVPKDGLCYFLGDIGFCNTPELADIIKQLNGTKVLILGNHDRNTYSAYEAGFDVVLNTAIIYVGKYRVSMSHCPLPGIFREDTTGMKGGKEGENWHGESKNTRFMSFDTKADYHLHGHIHSGPHNGKAKFTYNQYDVGVAANNYRPVSISAIESWISLQEKAKNDGTQTN
jgi:calcineurin-like phosphoesterase family protein